MLQRCGNQRIVFSAVRDIARGEELTLDYLPAWTPGEGAKLGGLKRCLCRTPRCRGWTL